VKALIALLEGRYQLEYRERDLFLGERGCAVYRITAQGVFLSGDRGTWHPLIQLEAFEDALACICALVTYEADGEEMKDCPVRVTLDPPYYAGWSRIRIHLGEESLLLKACVQGNDAHFEKLRIQLLRAAAHCLRFSRDNIPEASDRLLLNMIATTAGV